MCKRGNATVQKMMKCDDKVIAARRLTTSQGNRIWQFRLIRNLIIACEDVITK